MSLRSVIKIVFMKIKTCIKADRFAVGLGYGDLLEKALAKLFNDNSNFPLCDSWYAWKNHSHPHFNERVAELRVQTKKFEAKKQ